MKYRKGGKTYSEAEMKKLCKAGKAKAEDFESVDEDEENDDDGEDDDGDSDEDDSEKGNIDEDELLKSLDALEATVQKGPSGRRAELAKKADEGTLTKAEVDEFYELLGGSRAPSATEEIEQTFDDAAGPGYQEALQVSDLFKAFDEGHRASTRALIERLEERDRSNQTFDAALAKSVIRLGRTHVAFADRIEKSMKLIMARLGVIEQQPATKPRSLGVGGNPARPIPRGDPARSRSHTEREPAAPDDGELELVKGENDETFLKSSTIEQRRELAARFRALLEKSHDGRHYGGEDLVDATTALESFGKITPTLFKAAMAVREDEIVW